MTKLNRAELKKLLQENFAKVTFRKVNGELREMPCTLIPSEVPSHSEGKENESTLSVFCTDKKEWRAFRVENVEKVEII